jgi:excisionase family DNA binding protein
VISQQQKLELYPEWMDLKTVQRYACVSERKVREWIHEQENPLPAVQVEKGKILIKRSNFDHWLEAHAYRQAEPVDLGRIVDEVLNDLKQRPN